MPSLLLLCALAVPLLATFTSSSSWLDVPPNLASLATPIWAPSSSSGAAPEFVMARCSYTTKAGTSSRLVAAVAFVTAQQSPFCQPDPRLEENDYGACMPGGGTSQSKLFGAYKLFVNGRFVGMGPGRRINATQGVDVIDVTSAVIQAGAGGSSAAAAATAATDNNAIGLQGYHSNAFKGDDPRLLLLLQLHYADGSTESVATSPSWQTLDAGEIFNPSGTSGAWARGGGFPHESIDMRPYPTGWAEPGFDDRYNNDLNPRSLSWHPAAVAEPFVLPLGAKSALAARAVGVFERKASLVQQLRPAPSQASECGIMREGEVAVIGCSDGGPTAGATITNIAFACFGTVTGSCGASPSSPDSFKVVGGCNANDTAAVVRGACLGKESCSINVGVAAFGDPCQRVPKTFAWHVQCGSSPLSPSSPSPQLPQDSSSSSSTVLIDFGLEMQGGINLTFTKASAGQQVSIKLSEELLPESCASPRCASSVKVPMRTGNNFSDVWTLRDGDNVGVMQHEYMEFRYAQVEGPSALVAQLTRDTAKAWVIRYPLSDDPDDQYGDVSTLTLPSALRSASVGAPSLAVGTPTAIASAAGAGTPAPPQPSAQLAKFHSGNATLDAVWGLVRHTLVAVSLDVNTDSNTRQRDLCHTDAYITGVGQLAISSEYGVSQMTAEDAFQLDSNVWQGTADFRAALVSLAYEQALYSGDLSLVRQRYRDLQMHSLAGPKVNSTAGDADAGAATSAAQRPVGFFDQSLGLVNKSAGTMGSKGGKCPASWTPAGMPPGIYEELACVAADLIDWPAQVRDGYVDSSIGAVPNAYIAHSADRLSRIAGWLGNADDQAYYAEVSRSILAGLRTKLYDAATGGFRDGLRGGAAYGHFSMHATLFAAMAGAVDEEAAPGMGLAVVNFLKGKGMNCSCMAAYWLLEGLYKIGWHTSEAADHALNILTSTSTNSWLNMIAQGATAAMEAWTREEKSNLSWSHPWCAGANSVIVRLLLGVHPLDLGWRRWQFAPQPSSLPSIKAAVPSSKGSIDVTIANGPGKIFAATLTVPGGTAVRVCLPPPTAATAVAAAHGLHQQQPPPQHLEVDGAAVKSEVEGRMLCTVDDLVGGDSGAEYAVRRRGGS